MSVRFRAKLLHRLASGLVLLFALQLVAALACEFAPEPWVGRALYPLFLGRAPISLPNVLLNFGMLVSALASYYYADALEGESFFQEHFAGRRRTREGAVHFSQ